jgi:hypothetical protein
MATQNVNIGINVSDNGTAKKVVKNFQEIESAASKAQRAAAGISAAPVKSTLAPGGTTGSRRASEPAGSQQMMSGQEYGSARGSAGLTGASARDFANQAQGLGGLVRLYATWAANIFAVGAAYTALEEAATKTRMIEASELVSRRVGASMKNLAKDIQEATSYAVSYEEALQFGNLGVSAGIAAEQMKNLVAIAKGAANVLGRDVGDSVRRIVQGTAKQEQEILDELGIFVKAKDAYEKYAKDFEIKGGADALSAQEKVIAYANAVEDAGTKWKEFSKVEDPFSQFAAKGKEAIFGILSAANLVFVPILKFITQSAEGIAGLALLIGLRLTKQALPELGKAFQEALSFDKFRNEAKYQEAFGKLSDEFVKSNAQLNALKVEQTKILKDVFDPKVAAFTKFTDQMGGSMRRVASGVFGTEANPVDVNKYKNIESVNTAIEKSLLAQVKGSKDKEVTLQKIVALGLAEKTSTIEKITLDEKGRKISAEMYQLILQRQAGLAKELTIQQSINTLQEKSAGLKLQIDEVSVRTGTGTLDRLSQGAGVFSKAMGVVNTGWAGFKVGLGTSSILAEKFALAMQGGTIGLTGFLKTLPLVISNVVTAGTGLGILGRIAATTGAAFAGLAATVSAAFSAFLGPLMLAYTAWQLFGDSIMGLIPGYKEAKAREEALQKAIERGAESTKAYTGAMILLTKERAAGVATFEQYINLLDREEKITLQRISALDEEIKTLEEARAVRKAFALEGAKPPTNKEGELDTSSPEYQKKYWSDRRQEVKNGTDSEKVALDNIYLAYDQLAKAQRRAGFFNSNTDEIEAALLKVKKLERAYQGAEQAANRSKQQLVEPWELLKGAAEEAGKALEKAAQKDLKFPAIDVIKEVSLNNYAGKFALQISEIQKSSTPTEAQLLGLISALEGADKQALKAGASSAVFAIILEQLKKAGDKQEQLKLLPQLFGEIAQKAGEFYKVLSSSRANQDAVKSSRKTVELLKTDEDDKIKLFEKTSQRELDILKRSGDMSLKLIEARRTGRGISEGQALAERLLSIQSSEASELKLIEDNSQKRKKLVEDRIAAEFTTYQKNLKLAGKDTDLSKKATDTYTKSVKDLNSAQEQYNELQEKRKGEIKDSAFLRETELVESLKGKLYELTKAYKDAADERARSLKQAESDFDFDKAKSMMEPREATVAEATRNSVLQYEDQIRNATKLYEEAKKSSDDAIAKLGSTNPVSVQLSAITQAQSNNLNTLKSEVNGVSTAIGDLAGKKFDFDNLTKFSDIWTKILEKIDAVGDSFTAFGQRSGTAINATLKDLGLFGAQAEQNARSVQFYTKELAEANKGTDEKAKTNALKSLNKATEKQQKDEINGTIKVLSSAKTLFKEKTFAYKALEKIEKALHIYRMAAFIKENARDVFNTVQSVANSAVRVGAAVVEAGVDGVKAVVKAISSMPFPLNIAAGAATAAVVYGLVKSIGGSGGPGVSGGGGGSNGINDGTGSVLGDKTAKSETIKQGIEILQDSDPVLMRNSTNMLKHLRSIDNNIAAFSVALARSVGAGDIADRMEIRQGMAASNTGTALAFGLGGLALSKLPVIGNLISGLSKAFGFGTKTSVRGQGIELGQQTLGEAVTGGADAGFYADVQKKKQALFITYDKETTRERLPFSEADRDLQILIDRIFEGTYNTALAASETFGIKQADMQVRLSEYVLKAQAIPLSGTLQEQQAQLQAAFGKITDDLLRELLPAGAAFQRGGEAYGTTVARIVRGTDDARVALNKLGIEAIDFTDVVEKQGDVGAEIVRQSILAAERGDQLAKKTFLGITNGTKRIIGQEGNKFIADVIEAMSGTAEDIAEVYGALRGMQDTVIDFGGNAQFVSQAAADAAGGLEGLGDAIANFYDKFTTAEQKTALNTSKVTEVFGELGLQLPATRDEVFELVNALTSTDPQAAAKIMSATDALDDFYSRMENFAQKAKSMQMRILELTGTPEQLLAAQRRQTVEDTDPGLRATQQYIFALEDVKSAEDALTKARQDEANNLKNRVTEQQKATEGLVNNIKRYIESLRKFKDSLLLNAASPLTPAQKYAESKRQFDAILATATGTAVTPEELSAKEAALGQLEGSASQFLEASKVYNASSAQYTSDFNLVQEALTKSINTLAQQLTYEEKNLAALNSQINALQTVNTSVLSVADAVDRLAKAQSAAAALKTAATQEVNAAVSGQALSTQDLISAAKSSKTGFVYGGTVYGAQGLTTTVAESREAIADYVSKVQSGVEGYTARNMYNIFQDWGLSSKTIAEYMGITQDQVLGWFSSMDSSIPAFAQGTNFVPEDMLAQIHKGERIIPAADNTQLMQNLNSRDEANRVLVTEIRNLRSEVKQLREQQAAETGSIIVANFDAQQRAAEQIETAMNNTAQQSNWTAKVREGVKLK